MLSLHKYYYLSEFLELSHADDIIIDNIILNRHSYLITKGKNSNYIISVDQYIPGSFHHDYKTNLSSLKIRYKNEEYFVDSIEDIIGCRDFDIALSFGNDTTDCLCTAPDNKLIFSPQLTKYLLKHHFRIVDIKEKNDGSKEIIHVFLVEPGFYDCINEWKSHKHEKK